MKTRSRIKSGVVSIPPERDALSLEALMLACHDILNAAAALLMNVELLAEHARESSDGHSAADDARGSVQRIADAVGVIQAAARARGAAAWSGGGSSPGVTSGGGDFDRPPGPRPSGTRPP